MSKKAIGWFFFISFFLQIILLIVFLVCWQFYQSEMIGIDDASNCTVTTLSGQVITCLDFHYQKIDLLHNIMVICIVLMVLGSILGLIAWINTLINLSRGREWVWFVLTFFFGGITLFIYLIGGPAVPNAGSLPALPQNSANQFNPPLAVYPQASVFPPQEPVSSPQQASALEVLQMRFARGEIDAATFQQMSEMLKS